MRFAFGFGQRGQHQAGEKTDNRNDDEQFYQSKSGNLLAARSTSSFHDFNEKISRLQGKQLAYRSSGRDVWQPARSGSDVYASLCEAEASKFEDFFVASGG